MQLFPALFSLFTFELRSSLLTLGNIKASFALLLLNRSLHLSIFNLQFSIFNFQSSIFNLQSSTFNLILHSTVSTASPSPSRYEA